MSGELTKKKSLYDKTYFEKHCGVGYTQETTYLTLRAFVDFIINLKTSCMNTRIIKALDVGCARGYMVRMLREDGIEAWGVDISEFAIDNAPEEIKVYLKKIDVENEALPFPNRCFDLVISLSTFEHLRLEKLPFALCQINRILKPDGLLIINVPDPRNKTETVKPEHITVLSMEGWIGLIERFGFCHNPKYQKYLEVARIKEIAALYTSSRHSFRIMNVHLYFPKSMKIMVTYLMRLKRMLSPPNISLVFEVRPCRNQK